MSGDSPEPAHVVGTEAAPETEAPLIARVYAGLADGEFHSGQSLAQGLEVSRSAVWKAVRALRELGATVHAIPNRGYRLASGGEALDGVAIWRRLDASVRARLRAVQTVWSIHSTNTELMQRPQPPPGSGEALLAEYQSAGRGRRGRTWLAPPGGAVCLSLSWTFADFPNELGALSLAIGVCARRALAVCGFSDVRLKWPNDLLLADRKLAGVLIELRAEAAGPACVVIGIGVNVALGSQLPERIAASGLPATDLTSVSRTRVSRNALAAALIEAFVHGLLEFEAHGLKPFLAEWRGADALLGKPVDVTGSGAPTRGIARGIDLEGALMVETLQGLLTVVSGEVSVREVT